MYLSEITCLNSSGSQKVVLNDGILKNFIEQTKPKNKFKKYYITKILPLSLSNPLVQPLNKSWCL